MAERCRCYGCLKNHLNRPAYIEGPRSVVYVKGRNLENARADCVLNFQAITSVERFMALGVFVNDSLKTVLKSSKKTILGEFEKE